MSMPKGLLLIDAARNTIIVEADAIHTLLDWGKIDAGKIKRHDNISSLKSDVTAYLRGTYEEGKGIHDRIDLQR